MREHSSVMAVKSRGCVLRTKTGCSEAEDIGFYTIARRVRGDMGFIGKTMKAITEREALPVGVSDSIGSNTKRSTVGGEEKSGPSTRAN